MVEVVVAGGAGFIGSNFVHHGLEAHADRRFTTLDALTCAGRRENLADLDDHPRHRTTHRPIERPRPATGSLCRPRRRTTHRPIERERAPR